MTRRPYLPDADERARLNAALLDTGAETGFWDDDGRPAPWPDAPGITLRRVLARISMPM